MGKKDEALQLLREEYEKHNAAFLKIRDDSDLLTLQSDVRYQQLVSAIHYPVPGATIDTLHQL